MPTDSLPTRVSEGQGLGVPRTVAVLFQPPVTSGQGLCRAQLMSPVRGPWWPLLPREEGRGCIPT